jgi:uncharacterized protein (DUF2252 family)
VASGRAARRTLPRSSHGEWNPPPDRPDPVVLLEEQAETRAPELVPIRYGRMLVSPFTYYRGAALPMAADLAGTPHSGLRVQLCGDAHLSNFGVFGSPERRLHFDVNDFDETLPGPWEWDLKRLAVSMEVAGRDNGFDRKELGTIVRGTVASYRETMREFSDRSMLDVWYAHLDLDDLLPRFRSLLDEAKTPAVWHAIDRARAHDSMHAYEKLTQMVNGEPRIIDDPPLIVPIEAFVRGIDQDVLLEGLGEIVRAYRRSLPPDRRHLLEQYRLVHLARKVVGVGSVGTQAWIALLVDQDHGAPMFLQIKEAQASVLEAFLSRSEYDNHGRRVVAGQQLMQASSDIFLGWERTLWQGQSLDYYVRQLRDWKGSADVTGMTPSGMDLFGRMCGWTLARAHARSGDRIAIAAYLGRGDVFDRAIAVFAEAYADQNERDYALLAHAEQQGRIKVQSGI